MILTLVLTLTVGAAQQAQAQGILGRIRDAVGNAVPQKEQPAQPQPAAAPRVEGRTPSQIIAACPAFPSLNDLVITSVSYNMQLHGEPFYAEWKNALVRSDAYRHSIGALDDEVVALRDQITEAMRAKTGATIQREGEAFARQTTGRSMAEIQNMSEAELEAMGTAIANQRAASAGLGSMADIQALEGKSQEEILAATSGAGPVQGGTPAALKKAPPIDPAYERTNAQRLKMEADVEAALAEIEVELERIYQSHLPALLSRLRILKPILNLQDDGLDADELPKWNAEYPPAQRSWEKAQEEYQTDYFRYLLGAIGGIKEHIAAFEATVPEMKAPTADPAGGNAYDIAERYLEIAGSIDGYAARYPTDADL